MRGSSSRATLFDVFSVTALCEELFPGRGNALAQLWRAKQLQYSLLRSLMGRHKDFWGLTEDGLVYALEDVNVFKPSPRVDNLIAERLPGGPGTVGFVSSNAWDVAGAGSAGLTTYWIQRSAAEPEEELGFRATHLVGAMTDLPALLRV